MPITGILNLYEEFYSPIQAHETSGFMPQTFLQAMRLYLIIFQSKIQTTFQVPVDHLPTSSRACYCHFKVIPVDETSIKSSYLCRPLQY